MERFGGLCVACHQANGVHLLCLFSEAISLMTGWISDAFMDNKKNCVFSFKYVGAEQPLGGGLELANHSKVAFCVSVVQFNQCLVKMMNL